MAGPYFQTALGKKNFLADSYGDLFLALLSISELRHASETSTWWLRAWDEAGPVLVWITVALTVYSGLGFTWRHRELISPGQ